MGDDFEERRICRIVSAFDDARAIRSGGDGFKAGVAFGIGVPDRSRLALQQHARQRDRGATLRIDDVDRDVAGFVGGERGQVEAGEGEYDRRRERGKPSVHRRWPYPAKPKAGFGVETGVG